MGVNDGIVVEVLAQAVLYGTPILFAALGELLAERSGVLNLGVEGMMLVGAAMGFWGMQRAPGTEWLVLVLAVLTAAFAGLVMASIHAFLTVTLRASQIVSGLALTIFGLGLGLVPRQRPRARRRPGEAPVQRDRRVRARRPPRRRPDPLPPERARVRRRGRSSC